MWVFKLEDTVVVKRRCKACDGKGFKSFNDVRQTAYGTVNFGHSMICIGCAGNGGHARYLCRGRSLTPICRPRSSGPFKRAFQAAERAFA